MAIAIGLITLKWLSILTERPEVQFAIFVVGLGLDAGLEQFTGFGVVGSLVSMFFLLFGWVVTISSQQIFVIALFLGLVMLILRLPHRQ